ncbi:MAG: hydrolase [Gammaproteobacteria bacterium]
MSGADREAFRPAWFLPGPHLQTLWAALARRRTRLAVRPERLELPDGDFVDLAWTGPDAGPVAIVLHGLEGSLDSPYAHGILAALAGAGWRAVLLHFRGCSGPPNRLPRSYHSGETGDLALLVSILRARHPQRRLVAVGFSLGGNVLLKYLGEHGAGAGLERAVAISVPFDLADAADRLDRGFSRLYQRRLLLSLKQRARLKAALFPRHIDAATLAPMRNFRDFDDRVTAPLHGFAGADDYYRRCSSRAFMSAIAVPTLVLHARDDPFMTPRAIPKPEEISPSVRLEISAGGGHVGFVAGRVPWRPVYWLEHRILRFLREPAPAH